MGTAPTATSSRGWRWVLPVTLAVTGLVVVAGAHTAAGTDLRGDEQTRLVDLVVEQNARVDAITADVDALRRAVDAAAAAQRDGRVGDELAQRVVSLGQVVGVHPARGQGLRVALDDASVPESGVPEGFAPDDYVVHQQDVQGVVNALWAGGAEAIQVMDQRIVATSAVRCVGNTLILQGRVYAPPFTITAIGPPDRLSRALDAAPSVQVYRQWADLVGLGFDVEELDAVSLPGYEGSLDLTFARAAP